MASVEVCWPVPMRAIGAQNLLTMPGGVSMCGYLHKKGGSQFSLMKWPLRYIILHKGCVYYFKTSTSPSPQGAFSLTGYNRVMRAAEETTSSNVFPFKIVHFSKRHRTWLFSAASEEERRKWMRFLRKEIYHYNDRRESLIPCDADSDAESFYGSIEEPMDIKHSEDDPENDYMEEDDEDDEDDEDYVKPDSDCSPTHTGRPTVSPPGYPPPPVPSSLHLRPDARALPPPVPPLNKPFPCSVPKKAPPPFPPPHLLNDLGKKGAPPPSPPPNPKRSIQQRVSSILETGGCRRPSWAAGAPPHGGLNISKELESCMVLNGPARTWPTAPGCRGSSAAGSSNSRPALPPPRPPGLAKSFLRRSLGNSPDLTPSRPTVVAPSPHPAHPPPPPSHLRGGNRPKVPPPPTAKPPLPTARPNLGETVLQRASPDGQSFRTSVDEMPADFRKKRVQADHCTNDDSDDDYENVQLPDSVFIDTTETSSVEKFFKEISSPPPDGLYGIRNSGTKSSKVLVVWDISFGKARNYRLFKEDQHMYLDLELTFPSLDALIEHYHSHPLPHHSSLCLQLPYNPRMPYNPR